MPDAPMVKYLKIECKRLNHIKLDAIRKLARKPGEDEEARFFVKNMIAGVALTAAMNSLATLQRTI